MGNSQGVLIPKPIVSQLGLEGIVELRVRRDALEIRARRRDPRAGWAEDASRIAAAGNDALIWPEFANAGDDEPIW